MHWWHKWIQFYPYFISSMLIVKNSKCRSNRMMGYRSMLKRSKYWTARRNSEMTKMFDFPIMSFAAIVYIAAIQTNNNFKMPSFIWFDWDTITAMLTNIYLFLYIVSFLISLRACVWVTIVLNSMARISSNLSFHLENNQHMGYPSRFEGITFY